MWTRLTRWLGGRRQQAAPLGQLGQAAEQAAARQRLLQQAAGRRAGDHWTNQRVEAYPCTRNRSGRHGRTDRGAR